MQEIQLTEEQYQEVTELYNNLNDKLYSLGIMTYNESQLLDQIELIKKDKLKINDEIVDLNRLEEKLIDTYKQKYGNFEFDLRNKKIIIT